MDIKDLAGFAEPTKVLIEKCFDVLGGVASPFKIIYVAKSEAEAAQIKARGEVEVAKIKAEGEVQLLEVQERALQRLVLEEGKKQQNMEDVVLKALPEVKGNAKPQDIEDDWLTNFFDKCRLVSNEEMQYLWGKVLAGEANEPGTYSKRTVNLLQSLDRRDAINFQRLCCFSIVERNALPLIYDSHAIYKDNGVNMVILNNLQSIGLITFQTDGYRLPWSPRGVQITYFSHRCIIKTPEDRPHFHAGKITLTQPGRELAALCTTVPVDGFFDFLLNKWTELGYEVTPIPAKENS